MPLRLMLFFVLFTPLLGIIQVENGAYAANVAEWGHANGASYAFIAYSLCAIAGAWIWTRGEFFRRPPLIVFPLSRTKARIANRCIAIALVVNGLFCALTLLLFGGLSVLLGEVGKGDFRSSLGGLGAFAYLTLKWLAPSTFALACAQYVFAGRPTASRKLLVALGLLTFLIGMSWGFKSSGLLVLLPGFVILLWRATLRSVVVYTASSMFVLLAAFMFFDTVEGSAYESALQFLVARLTVFQGDVSWYLWGQWIDGASFPGYAVTLSVAIGDQLFTLLSGISRDDGERWILVHYGSLLTYVVGYPIEGIQAGHSVTGTPFSEGLIAMGAPGILVFGVLAGVVSGFLYGRIASAMRRQRAIPLALWSNYSVWCAFAWLNGGEIVQLFHISVIVGAMAAWTLLKTLLAMAEARKPVDFPTKQTQAFV